MRGVFIADCSRDRRTVIPLLPPEGRDKSVQREGESLVPFRCPILPAPHCHAGTADRPTRQARGTLVGAPLIGRPHLPAGTPQGNGRRLSGSLQCSHKK